MHARTPRVATAATVASACLAACGPGLDSMVLQVTANPTAIVSDGTTTDLTILAIDTDGRPGRGVVVLSTDRGLVNDTADETAVILSDGVAHGTYACNRASDYRCVGSRTVRASWSFFGASVDVEVYAPFHDGGQ